jgi:hypothetical protein
MKKLAMILGMALVTLVTFAQSKSLKSITYYQGDINYIKKTFERTITIDGKTITITKFGDSNSNDLKLTINKTEEKEWSGLPCTWYYCTSAATKPEKVVVILLPGDEEVDVFMYIQEVYPLIFKLAITKK